MDQANGKIHSGISGFPPPLSLLLTVAFWRWILDPNKPCKPYSTVARSNFERKEISGADRRKLGGFNTFPFQLSSLSPPFTPGLVWCVPTNAPDPGS